MIFEKHDRFETLHFLSPDENAGQVICGAGPLFLRMVLAVILAVTVYSTHAQNVETHRFVEIKLH